MGCVSGLETERVQDAARHQQATRAMQGDGVGARGFGKGHEDQAEGHPFDEIPVLADAFMQDRIPALPMETFRSARRAETRKKRIRKIGMSGKAYRAVV